MSNTLEVLHLNRGNQVDEDSSRNNKKDNEGVNLIDNEVPDKSYERGVFDSDYYL